jgi:hypothetical protein
VSYESTSVLPGADARRAAVLDVLRMLGYERAAADKGLISRHYWFEEKDYRSYTGVLVVVRKGNGRDLEVETHAPGARSYWDYEQQVRTIRTLRRFFGGRFETDSGTNRFWADVPLRALPAQAGCHRAFERLGRNIIRAHIYLMNRAFPQQQWQQLTGFDELDRLNPRLLSNHLLLPFLVAAIEDYLKSAFVALLRYSTRKMNLLRPARLPPERLRAVSDGTLTIEDAIAAGLPFQNILAAFEQFRILEPKLDLAGELRRPFRRRRERLLESLQRLVERRHAFIHRVESDLSFDDEDVARAVADVEVALTRVQERIYGFYGWPMDRGWYAGGAVRIVREARARVGAVGKRLTGPPPARPRQDSTFKAAAPGKISGRRPGRSLNTPPPRMPERARPPGRPRALR